MQKPNNVVISLTATFVLAGLLFAIYRNSQTEATISSKPKKLHDDDDDDDDDTTTIRSTTPKQKPTPSPPSPSTPQTTNTTTTTSIPSQTPSDTSTTEMVHKQVEDIDKRGKTLYKSKQYLPAATCFTEALDLLSTIPLSTSKRQVVTITNNRSAMYEKAGLAELALEDCERILAMEKTHLKARLRKLRVLEGEKRFVEALVEVCALQLNFMNENRDKIRMQLAIPQPPVSQSKIEELLAQILPAEMDSQFERNKSSTTRRSLPSVHTIVQLLQSFTGYNSWMASAAREGSADALTKKIEETEDSPENSSAKAILLYKRGMRYAYDGKYEKTTEDIDSAYKLAKSSGCETDMKEYYVKLLEWAGTCRHLRYDLKGADECYRECIELDPANPELLVKRAGVKMDAADQTTALSLFSEALTLDPAATDALLHRANLYMLQNNPSGAKSDLESCLQLRPDNLIARLRLATVYMTLNDLENAKKHVDLAEELDNESSEVHSYRGEMHFAMNEIAEARKEFDLAIKCNPLNPTPYVNAALAVMNTGTMSSPPDVPEAIALFEKAIKVDPQFHAAYVQLGQLKLSTARNLTEAEEVVSLYDDGVKVCRTKEELKDICGMRLLTVAQVDAAQILGMETLNMQ